jgi:hypothetical protein
VLIAVTEENSKYATTGLSHNVPLTLGLSVLLTASSSEP